MSGLASSPRYEAETTDRPQAIIYTRDLDSEGVLRQSLPNLPREMAVFHSEGIKAAAAEIAEKGSPRLLIVDVSGESDVVDKVRDLCGSCEPSTHVIVLGQENDIRLYRALLDAGVSEYFFKPLVSTMVSRSLRKLLLGEETSVVDARVGRVVYVVGVRGACGDGSAPVRSGRRPAPIHQRVGEPRHRVGRPGPLVTSTTPTRPVDRA